MKHWSYRFSSDEMMREIRRLAQREKLTAGQIADHLGCTRDVVIGFVNRSRPRIRLPGKRGGEIVSAPVRPAKIDATGPVHQRDLEQNSESISDGKCRFPLWPDRIGKPRRPPTADEMYYCGRPVAKGCWCEEHAGRVFEPRNPPVKPGEGRKTDGLGRRVGWQYGT